MYNAKHHADSELFARFTAFMVKIVTSARVDYIRRQRHWQWEIATESFPDILDEQPSLEERMIKASMQGFYYAEDRIAVALSALRADERWILELAYIDELSMSEIAVLLGRPIKFVYNQKYVALQKLRKALLPGGGNDA